MSDYFPPEIILQILIKLPVKSLIRFTTVCKSWRSTITGPSFISSHFDSSKNQFLLIRRYDKNDRKEYYSLLEVEENKPFSINSSSGIEFHLKSQIGYFRIVGSCRGVLCLSDDFFVNSKRSIVLLNPCVKKHIVLPECTINPRRPYGFVLGFGVVKNDFKVVRVVYYRKRNDSLPEAEVFSLGTGEWRRLWGIKLRLHMIEFMWSQVLLDGVVHWLGYDSLNGNRVSVLVFRLAQDVFDEIQLPDELAREGVANLSLASIGESLGVIKYDRELGSESCDVWLMKEYGVESSWMKLYSFSMVEGMEKVVAFRKKDEALVASRGIGLVAWDLGNMERRSLGIQGTTHSFYAENYVESLELMRGEI